jgi:hypothetical protein
MLEHPVENPDPGGPKGVTVLECLRIFLTASKLPLADPAVDEPFPSEFDSEKSLVTSACPYPHASQPRWFRQLEMLLAAPSLPPTSSILWDYRHSLDVENGCSWMYFVSKEINRRALHSASQTRWAVLVDPNAEVAEYAAHYFSGTPDSLIDFRVFLDEEQTLAWLTRSGAPSPQP